MITGILSISMDPCYVGFTPNATVPPVEPIYRHLSCEELKQLLIALGLPDNHHTWPSHELILHLPVALSSTSLRALAGNHELPLQPHTMAS